MTNFTYSIYCWGCLIYRLLETSCLSNSSTVTQFSLINDVITVHSISLCCQIVTVEALKQCSICGEKRFKWERFPPHPIYCFWILQSLLLSLLPSTAHPLHIYTLLKKQNNPPTLTYKVRSQRWVR